MSIYYLYCRPGFEKDLAAEIQQKAALKEIFGYCRLQANAGYIEFDAMRESVMNRRSILTT